MKGIREVGDFNKGAGLAAAMLTIIDVAASAMGSTHKPLTMREIQGDISNIPRQFDTYARKQRQRKAERKANMQRPLHYRRIAHDAI